MSFQLVPKLVTLNEVMAVILRYFTEFGKPALQHITASAHKKQSLRLLSHLLMSFFLRWCDCM